MIVLVAVMYLGLFARQIQGATNFIFNGLLHIATAARFIFSGFGAGG
jgi:hypothetical protein